MPYYPSSKTKKTPIALGLGANLANPETTFASAIQMLSDNGVLNIIQASLYKTAPVDCHPGIPDFTNSAIIGEWNDTPQTLLTLTQSIEVLLGRPKKHDSHSSRVIDIDILLFGTETQNTQQLILPHPRLHQRYFALAPLAEIAGDWIVPGFASTVRQLLQHLKTTSLEP